jgi:SAM-dependent methyltransferase
LHGADRSYWERRYQSGVSLGLVGDISVSASYNRWLYRVREHMFARALAAIPRPQRQRVLEVGSGSGFYVELWRRTGAQVWPSDLTDASVAHLRARFPELPVARLDICDGSGTVAEQRFDVVSAFDMLFHITGDAAYKDAIRHVAAFLPAGGFFLCTEALVDTRRELVHQVLRPERFILGVLHGAGFDVIRRLPMSCFMNDPVRGSRTLRRVYGLLARAASSEWGGELAGAAAFPFELAAIRLLHLAGATELLVCRKR